jgi:site-specific DNA recombinase
MALKKLLEEATASLSRLDELYQQGDVYHKRQIVSTLYPENLVYDMDGFRTPRMNEVIAGLFSLGTDLTQQKSVQTDQKIDLYAKEVSSGFEPL